MSEEDATGRRREGTLVHTGTKFSNNISCGEVEIGNVPIFLAKEYCRKGLESGLPTVCFQLPVVKFKEER